MATPRAPCPGRRRVPAGGRPFRRAATRCRLTCVNLYWRFLALVLRVKLRRKVAFTDPTALKFRVWPTDLDVAGHMNNARYVMMLDLGRLDHWIRSGLWDELNKLDYSAVVGAQTIRYRRSLKPWEKFTLTSTILGWDERALFQLHEFTVGGVVAARAVVQLRIVGKKGGAKPTTDVIATLGDVDQPSLPAWVKQWAEDVRTEL